MLDHLGMIPTSVAILLFLPRRHAQVACSPSFLAINFFLPLNSLFFTAFVWWGGRVTLIEILLLFPILSVFIESSNNFEGSNIFDRPLRCVYRSFTFGRLTFTIVVTGRQRIPS